jgi:putative thioredoxin
MENFDFEEDVLMRSQEVPVVVDFWAPWCGPCQVLGPVIEQLAGEANGKWELVKVNTDEKQEISAKYGIRGIPAVKMFYMGEVKAEFTGALPKYQIEKWLYEHLPDEKRDQLKSLDLLLFTDRHAEAVQGLEVLAEANPEMEEAQLWLAAATIGQHPERAQHALHHTHQLYELGENVKILGELMLFEETPEPALAEKLEAARQALKSYQYEACIQALIQATMLNKNFCNELPRRASVALFKLIGQNHPITRQYRRQFDMALY